MYRNGPCTYVVSNVYRSIFTYICSIFACICLFLYVQEGFMYIHSFQCIQVPFYVYTSLCACTSPFSFLSVIWYVQLSFSIYTRLFCGVFFHVCRYHFTRHCPCKNGSYAYVVFNVKNKKESFLIVYTSLAMCTQAAFMYVQKIHHTEIGHFRLGVALFFNFGHFVCKKIFSNLFASLW